MSSNLYWRPKNPAPPRRGGWPISVKSILVKKYFDEHGDGSLSYPYPVTLTLTDVPFLDGVSAGTNSESVSAAMRELIEGLYEHSEIEIWVE